MANNNAVDGNESDSVEESVSISVAIRIVIYLKAFPKTRQNILIDF